MTDFAQAMKETADRLCAAKPKIKRAEASRLRLAQDRSVRVKPQEAPTKQGMVLPFIQALGYDIFDVEEVRPEADAARGTKAGDKVDYAVGVDGRAYFLIECKALGGNLSTDQDQLRRYYDGLPKIAILTDGERYWFYADFDRKNHLDHEPSYRLNVCDLTVGELEILAMLRRDAFDEAAVLGALRRLRQASRLRGWVERQMANPSNDLVKLAMRESGFKGNRTAAEVESWSADLRREFARVKGAASVVGEERDGKGLIASAEEQVVETVSTSEGQERMGLKEALEEAVKSVYPRRLKWNELDQLSRKYRPLDDREREPAKRGNTDRRAESARGSISILKDGGILDHDTNDGTYRWIPETERASQV